MAESVSIMNVEGMTCEGCVQNVTKALKSVKGTNDVQVSFEKKKATVRFDPERTNEGSLKKAVVRAGYNVG